MSNLAFYSISDLELTRFLDDHNITVKFWYRFTAKRYYRLRCVASSYTPSGFSTIYIYLGNMTTSPKSDYTALRRIEKITNASAQTITFEDLFTQYSDRISLQPLCYLQSSPREDFSAGVEESSEGRLFSIKLTGDNFGPTWSAPSFVDELYSSNAGVALLTGSNQKGLQGISRIRFDFPQATARYGTTLDHYSISVTGGFSHSLSPSHIQTVGSDYLSLKTYYKLVGDVTVTFTVEDSRGMKTSTTRTITIVPYKSLYLTANDTHRQGGTGSTVLLNFSGNWYGSPLTLSCTSIVAYEEGSSGTFASLTPQITESGKSFSYNAVWSGVSFDPEKSYSIRATFTDGVKTVVITLPIPVGTPVLSIRKGAVGINNPSPTHRLDVAGTIAQNGYPVLGYVGTIGTRESCDLNDYTDTGIYIYDGSSDDVYHFPNDVNVACMLIVIAVGDYKVQRLFFMGGQTDWTRVYSLGWNSWT